MSADQTHAWAAALGGLSGAELANGLNALVQTSDEQLRKWPPSAQEFRALCAGMTPEALGLPSFEEAYREACRRAYRFAGGITRSWSHPAVCHAALETGFHALESLSEDASRKIFERNYSAACRMVSEGEPLRSIPKGLPTPETVSAGKTKEGAQKGIAMLRQALQGGRA